MYKIEEDPVFWSFFITSTSAFLFGIIKILSKSKCKRCKFMCFEIDRDVVLEEKENEYELTHPRQEISIL